MTIDKVIP